MAAILSALQEATFQICGVRISSTLDVKSTQIEDDDGVRMIDWINRSVQASTAKRECEIEGYDVLEISGDGTQRARHAAGSATRSTRCRARPWNGGASQCSTSRWRKFTSNGVGGGRLQKIDGRVVRVGIDVDVQNVWNLQDEFRSSVEALLTQGRRFGVLDRSRPDVYEAEKQLLQSGDAGPGERARLGKVLGADYLLYGVIDRVVVEDQSKTIEITGERKNRLVGLAEIRFSVLATATRQVKWSSSIAMDRVFPARIHPEAAAAAVLQGVAAAMVDELTENIYPPKVTAVVAPGQFVVNRGGKTVAPGDLFEVFVLGEQLIDPDTGESLDRIEMSVGIAQILVVKPKYSVAELISGSAELSRGMVLRRRVVDAGGGVMRVDQEPSFRDDDGDGLPDYLNRL